MADWQYSPNCLVPADKALPEGVKRYAVGVEYDGAVYCGWQKQSHSPGIQAEVDRALARVANSPVETICAGRTDTGVHATNQVIHFDTKASRPSDNWLKGTNTYLPENIRIHWVKPVCGQFHARFSATSRTYRYIICNSEVKPALLAGKVSLYRRILDEGKMAEACACLIGEQDFSSFRAVGCQSNSPFRNVTFAHVWRQNDLVIFEISANAFLYHMVRNLVGALIKVGTGELTLAAFIAIFKAKDRKKAPATANASGLYLAAVDYPESFGIPVGTKGPPIIFD